MAKLPKVIADAGLLSAALEGLILQRDRLEEQIRQIRTMLGNRRPGKAAAAAPASGEAAPAKKRKRRKMSAEARKRIAEAQKKRWAAYRKAQG